MCAYRSIPDGFACSRRDFIHLAGSVLLARPGGARGRALPECGNTPVVQRDDICVVPDPAAATGNAQIIGEFAHVTDMHLVDAANPLRATLFDALFDSAWHPQQHLSVGVWDSVLAHMCAQEPDWVMSTGDQVDNGLIHELDWFLAVGDGVDLPTSYTRQVGGYPDWRSLFNDAPVPLVTPSGCGCPWYAALGNHDLLALGVFSPLLIEQVFGPVMRWKQRWPERFPEWQFGYLDRPAALDAFRASTCSGFTGLDRGYYAFTPAPALRCIVLDTAVDDWIADQTVVFLQRLDIRRMLSAVHDAGRIDSPAARQLLRAYVAWIDGHPLAASWHGAIDQQQFEWLRGEIDAYPDSLCLVFSHHGPDNFVGLPGHCEPHDFIALLQSRPQVIAHLYGHTHCNRVIARSAATAPDHAYWDVTTGSLAEFPMQWRSVRIHDQGDGTGMLACRMRGPALDAAWPDPLFDRAFELAATDRQIRRYADWLCGTAADRNVDLPFPLPPAVAARLRRV